MQALRKWIETELFSMLFSTKPEEKEFKISDDIKLRALFLYPEIFQTYINNEKLLEIKFDINKNLAEIYLNLNLINSIGIVNFKKNKVLIKINNKERMFLHTAIIVSRILKSIFSALFLF